MKTICFLQVLFCSLSVWAQPYSINWFTTDAGGGLSVGGPYSMSGTTGQPDAGPSMRGGIYQAIGGFWFSGSAAVPTAPELSIGFISDVALLLSWPGDQAGFTLQQSASLTPPVSWINVDGLPTLISGRYQYPYVIDSKPRFFRLIRR